MVKCEVNVECRISVICIFFNTNTNYSSYYVFFLMIYTLLIITSLANQVTYNYHCYHYYYNVTYTHIYIYVYALKLYNVLI